MLNTYLLSITCIVVSCNGNSNIEIVQSEKAHDTIIKQVITNEISLSIQALQGIRAENDEDNALFFTKSDSLYYVEDQTNPVKIQLNIDTLLIMRDISVNFKILKLTKDSLWFTDELKNTPTKLYKR